MKLIIRSKVIREVKLIIKYYFMVSITNRSSSFPTIAFIGALFTKNIAKYRFAMVL